MNFRWVKRNKYDRLRLNDPSLSSLPPLSFAMQCITGKSPKCVLALVKTIYTIKSTHFQAVIGLLPDNHRLSIELVLLLIIMKFSAGRGGRLLITWLDIVSLDSTEIFSYCFPWVPGWRSVNLCHLFIYHPLKIWLLVTRREVWFFENREENLTFTQWLRAPLLLPRCSAPMLAI